MADLNPKVLYEVTFTVEELRVLDRALGGRMRSEDAETAVRLRQEIANAKAQKLGQMAVQASRHATDIKGGQ